MRVRDLFGSLQLPVALVGVALLAASLGQLATLPGPPAEGDGFPAGIAVLALYVGAWLGIVLTAAGLAIPPGNGIGIAFGRWQRRLFVLAAMAALASALLPVFAFGLLFATAMEGSGTVLLLAWGGPMIVAVLALAGGVAWRLAEVARPYLDGAGTNQA